MSTYDPQAQRRAPAPPALTRANAATPASPGASLVPPFVAGRTLQPHGSAASHNIPPVAHPVRDEPLPWEVTADASGATTTDSYAWMPTSEQGAAVPAWQDELEAAESAPSSAEFPLDAFIIPEDAERLPSGYELEHDAAEHVAERLEEIARQVRTRGIGALGNAAGSDELSRRLAGVISEFVNRGD